MLDINTDSPRPPRLPDPEDQPPRWFLFIVAPLLALAIPTVLYLVIWGPPSAREQPPVRPAILPAVHEIEPFQSPPEFRIGQECWVVGPWEKETYVASDRLAWTKLADALVATDSYGVAELMDGGAVFQLRGKTEVKVLGCGDLLADIRVLSGPHRGKRAVIGLDGLTSESPVRDVPPPRPVINTGPTAYQKVLAEIKERDAKKRASEGASP